ncbi:Polyphosphoinositide phosphatase [Halotydeus destructor]|nr:Polyphosphoinositide phosphatase [Halotydeus destructor]
MAEDINGQMIISWVQRVALYETKARFYLIGSNNTQTKFRVLKIDRTEPKDLVVVDDKFEYNQSEIRDILSRINHGNRPAKSSNTGLSRLLSAFGLLGFVRFTEGFYIILITKRRRVAQIGHHIMYKIEDTHLVYIPSESKKVTNEEARYQKMFQNVDLSSNFYFSYSYDLSHTIQYNLSPQTSPTIVIPDGKTIWEADVMQKEPKNKIDRVSAENKFVWNHFLLPDYVDVHSDWVLHIIHGFVSQSNISVFGKPLNLTLIARRSRKYAGTRFLKRGSNMEGDVGNEVETEQIVHDSSISSFSSGRFTSFVQIRGSVPSLWSQDVQKMVPKPLIQMDIIDPHHKVAGLHFNQLFARYGSPIKVLNLVKKREKRPHESVLSNEFINIITYLNQFMPPSCAIEHISFDMACVNKLKDGNVMSRLSDIAAYCLKEIGIFKSWPSASNLPEGGHCTLEGRVYQTGTVRVNCVDCLDRTNTAQFAVGRCALGTQLMALGVIDTPHLEFETDVIRMLEELYEDHGDTLALQYGGSQLVHRIKTYRKIAPLSSHSRDIMQTLSRYYSNTFSDAEKQNAINLFLGVYEPCKRDGLRMPHIWEMQTDYYLHNTMNKLLTEKLSLKPNTWWWDEEIAFSLPRAAHQVFKAKVQPVLLSVDKCQTQEERADGFYEQYRPYELTVIAETLALNMLHTEKDFMPHFTTDPSPFMTRLRPDKRREPEIGKTPLPSLSLSQLSATQSSSQSEADSDEDSDDDDDLDIRFTHRKSEASVAFLPAESSDSGYRSFQSVLTDSKAKYGLYLKPLSRNDVNSFSNYIEFGIESGMYRESLSSMKTCNSSASHSNGLLSETNSVKSSQVNSYEDDVYKVKSVKAPSLESMSIYSDYINRAKNGPEPLSQSQKTLFQNYLKLSK